MRDLPEATCWYEGMHLLPQHFQLQDLRAEAVSARLSESAQPWYWGVRTLQIDTFSLAGGLLRITALEAVMPDGLVVDFDPLKDKETPLQLKLKAEDFGDQTSLMIYLAVAPLWRSGQLVPLKGRLRSTTSLAVPDMTGSDAPAEAISSWRPNPQLVTAPSRADSICMPLFRLGYEDGTFSQLRFSPPCPVVSSDSVIGKRVSDLCVLVRRKCEFLSGRWRQSQEAGKSIESAELRIQLGALWSRLPELQAALEMGIAHPATLYLQLVGMAGALACLQPEAGVRTFTALNYGDLLQAFDEVLDWLETRLNNIRAGYSRRNFVAKEKLFSITLTDRQTPDQNLVIGLRMPPGSPPQLAGDWLGRAIIASRSQLPTLIRQRMQGFACTTLDRNEQVAYGVGEDVRLFRVQARGDWFAADQDLCLFMPSGNSGIEPIEAMLFDTSKSD